MIKLNMMNVDHALFIERVFKKKGGRGMVMITTMANTITE